MVRATLDTLYINGIVEVWSVGKSKGKHSNYYRLNYEKFKEYEQYSMDELKQPHLKIETVKGYNLKGYSPSYLKNDSQELPNDFPSFPQITNNIDNINNKDNIDIKEDINNNDLDIEESYKLKINELFEKGYSFPKMFKELASTDWECYKYFKNRLKENNKTRSICIENLDLLRDLNDKYEP